MTWLLRTLASAVIAGIGWKLGTDAVEYLKKQLATREPTPSAKPPDATPPGDGEPGPVATGVASPAP